jgi:hypothetical protein
MARDLRHPVVALRTDLDLALAVSGFRVGAGAVLVELEKQVDSVFAEFVGTFAAGVGDQGAFGVLAAGLVDVAGQFGEELPDDLDVARTDGPFGLRGRGFGQPGVEWFATEGGAGAEVFGVVDQTFGIEA